MTAMTKATMERAPRSRQSWIPIIFGLVIFIPCILGFGTKFLELIKLSHTDLEGRFALTPVVNYLLATIGFLCLFVWGALRGTFHNVEDAKQRMLDFDELIDEASRQPAEHVRLSVCPAVEKKSVDQADEGMLTCRS
jgi:hypothetical protein